MNLRTTPLVGTAVVALSLVAALSLQAASITLVRDDGASNRWYLPAKELKRLEALLNKEGKNGAEAGAAPPAGESS